ISPPGEQFSAEEFDAESRDFSATLFLLRRPTQPLRADSFYIRDPANADGSCPSDATAAVNACFVEVGSAVPPSYVKGPPDPTSLEIGVGAKLGVYYRGASGDLSHIVFAAQHPEGGRWPGDTAKSGESLF